MCLADRVGISAPKAELHHVGETPFYLVERYDRSVDEAGNVQRIHQEDFCQALSIQPENKYEREGGPTIASCGEVIAGNAARPAVDRLRFLDLVIFNYLIGNADAHGKNFSLLYIGEKPELAPAYDLLSTAIYPEFSQKMAMKIGGKYKPSDVVLRHWDRLVPETKAAQSLLRKQLDGLAVKTLEEALVLQADLSGEGIQSPVFEQIIGVIKERAFNLTL